MAWNVLGLTILVIAPFNYEGVQVAFAETEQHVLTDTGGLQLYLAETLNLQKTDYINDSEPWRNIRYCSQFWDVIS